MLTLGDIEYEPDSPKILKLTNSVVVLASGDWNIQTQIYEPISAQISERVNADPDNWLSVAEAAQMYRDKYVELRREAAELAILQPLGLNQTTFISRQRMMSSELIQSLTEQLTGYRIPDAHTIIAGVDSSGAHIFAVENDIIINLDRVGFAAVGIGATHARSHLMLSKYSPSMSETKALVAVHKAKKKAEVSPGVGEGTDLFVLGPTLGSFTMLSGPDVTIPIVQDLDDFYKTYTKSIEELDKETEEKIQHYISETVAGGSPPQEAEATVVESTDTKGPGSEDKPKTTKPKGKAHK